MTGLSFRSLVRKKAGPLRLPHKGSGETEDWLQLPRQYGPTYIEGPVGAPIRSDGKEFPMGKVIPLSEFEPLSSSAEPWPATQG